MMKPNKNLTRSALLLFLLINNTTILTQAQATMQSSEQDQQLVRVPIEKEVNAEGIEQPIMDPSEAREVDYSFFNDPYILEQQAQQPLYDLNEVGVSADGVSADAEKPIVDITETTEVDFSYFNDPYAFDKFRTGLPIKAKFGGYVQHSSWWDSRQGVEAGDGYVFIYPKKRKFDVDCRDINARGEFNMTMIETRLRGEFFGPEILGAETFAYIESDFFGSGVVINRMRLRHAFIQMTWQDHSKILLGQFWHPTFVVKCFPLTVSFDGGIPYEPFSRNPQVRYTNFEGNKELLIAAIAQLQFTSNGPIGFSSTYLRNARLPILIARAAYDTERIYAGGGVTFQRLQPRIESDKGFRVNEYINSAQAFAFATVKFEPVEIRQKLTFAQNANNLAMLSGFAVTSVNPTTDERHYTNTAVAAYWMDININKQIEPGLFIGVSKNLGAQRDIIQCIKDPATGEEQSTIYSFGEDIDLTFRVAPRIRFHVLPVDFATEIEYSWASFGCLDNRAKVQNTDPVANTRLLFTAYYYF